MSSAQPQAGGIIIMSHVTPRDASTPGNEEQRSNSLPSEKSLSKFFKGEPEVLGVTQIFVGLLHISLGVSLYNFCKGRCFPLDILVHSSVALWSGILYCISGSLSVTAAKKPTKRLVKASLILNTLSTAFSGVALFIFFVFFLHGSNYFKRYAKYTYCYYLDPMEDCKGNFNPVHAVMGIVVVLFLHALLEFCVSLSMSIFGCKTVCRTSESDVAVVIYQNASINVPADSGAITQSSDHQ
ncbi:membrane-spanning 4-domains subfamily A member 4D-like [Spea bombifrons]|uniref:membrane-spanning 4-domains subfamily A member 4D-like n=1 Tax=Spea bombifrons TaxID=233779 RepID=UPI002349377E|nr:membrane-spanning 4-domains subfamily A member 4D-like [Spea bombifrons]